MKKIFNTLLIVLLVLNTGACSNKNPTILSDNQLVEEDSKQIKATDEIIEEETKQDEIIEEYKEEVKIETDTEVLKSYKYWVVFFDHDGTELQREALKYGTTPTYWSDIPYYSDGEHWYKFVGWTNKKGKDKPFIPITGNTYFYAKYEIGGDITHESSGGESTPTPPAPSHFCQYSSTYLFHVTYCEPTNDVIYDKYQWDGTKYVLTGSGLNASYYQFDPTISAGEQWLHLDSVAGFLVTTLCEDHEAHTLGS